MRIFLFIFVLFMSTSTAACKVHEVAGKTSRDLFEDKKLRRLVDTACNGKVDQVKSLIESGVDVDGEGLHKVTPLTWALSCQNLEGIDVLLTLGADPNKKSKNGYTPTTISASYDDPRFLKRFLQAGGDPNSVFGSKEETILMLAFRSGVDHDEWTKYYMLLDAGADINHVTNKGKTIAIWGASLFRRQCIILDLMSRGYSAKLDELLDYVERYPPLETSPDAMCQDALIKTIKARITKQK